MSTVTPQALTRTVQDFLSEAAGAVVLVSLLMTACSSSSTTAAAPRSPSDPYVNQSGTGNKTLAAVALPSLWTVTWRFDCEDPSTRRPFELTATKAGASPVTVTKQTGLGGGGFKPFRTAGTFTFAVTTSCGWTVSVRSGRGGTSTTGTTAATST